MRGLYLYMCISKQSRKIKALSLHCFVFMLTRRKETKRAREADETLYRVVQPCQIKKKKIINTCVSADILYILANRLLYLELKLALMFKDL